MKRRGSHLILCFVLIFTGLSAQDIHIQPTPQDISATGKTVLLPGLFRYEGDAQSDSVSVAMLKAVFKEGQPRDKFTIIVGKKGDKAVKKYEKNIPNYPEAYFLKVTDDKIILAGNNERGIHYAVVTLLQLKQGDNLPEIEIRDYPDIRYRGVVEGFYGTPWSYEDRARQLEFYGKNKLNTYIYGPKDDPYHSSPHWRKPYPEKEAGNILKLIEISRRNKVDFVWAVHPGKDIKWSEEDRNALMAKFESMYQLGVRSFAVFFDDIGGVGADPSKQAEMLNYIDNNFIKLRKDVTPLIMCPTEYNKSWTNLEKGYLTTLGAKLNPSIYIMWTGDRVISEIKHTSLEWINNIIHRPAYVWWNFPVSDYVRDHLLMGRVYGNDNNISEQLSGFVANPMERAEASKIAIYSIADYSWNLKGFDSHKSWRRSVKDLMPRSCEALQLFANHNSDLGQNGHGFRREESVDIKPLADRILTNLKGGKTDENDMIMLSKEFEDIVKSANILLASKDNETLMKEIKPWVYQFKNMGETGCSLVRLIEAFRKEDITSFLQEYDNIEALCVMGYDIDHSYNQNPYQPGIKTGTLVLQPLIATLYEHTMKNYNLKYNTELNTKMSYNPHKLGSNIGQIKNLVLQTRHNQVIVPPVLEIVKWGKDERIQIELDKVYPLQNLRVDFGQQHFDSWIAVEVSDDNANWQPISIGSAKGQSSLPLQGVEARYVRITNNGEDREINFKRIVLTLKK